MATVRNGSSLVQLRLRTRICKRYLQTCQNQLFSINYAEACKKTLTFGLDRILLAKFGVKCVVRVINTINTVLENVSAQNSKASFLNIFCSNLQENIKICLIPDVSFQIWLESEMGQVFLNSR